MNDSGDIAPSQAASASRKRRFSTRFFCVLGWVAFGIAVGIPSGLSYERHHLISQMEMEDLREATNDGAFHFTNPLLECANGSNTFTLRPRPSKEAVEEHINAAKARGDITHASVYYRDLNIGAIFQIHADELFAPASLLKVPLMMYWLKRAESDPSILQERVQFTDDPHGTERQYFKSPDPVKKGQTYTIEDLTQRLVAQSDNDAADALAQMATKENLKKMFQDMRVDLPQDGGDRMSVSEYARFFRLLFNASYLSRDNSEKALRFLSQSTFQNGMVAKLPSDVIVAHKFGERLPNTLPVNDADTTTDRQLHDCGIVYAPGRPYLLCIMTRGGNVDRLATSIADISKLVYDQVTASNK